VDILIAFTFGQQRLNYTLFKGGQPFVSSHRSPPEKLRDGSRTGIVVPKVAQLK
jgi:hypothetical protein